ncbi:hypothetical protein HPB51_014406 [Rhipicephalus microplus]|uniref:Uncharacterized protein n=1 Tax=Rhipicephalus microplus TaxID=6941 RepID=A0A9J6F375_RHIMP|nr:hypothetical protein HPB51_014406 [Rhipicephalus microplus]
MYESEHGRVGPLTQVQVCFESESNCRVSRILLLFFSPRVREQAFVNITPAVLGFTNTRCLAQSIRNLLVCKGVPFEEKQYRLGPAPGFEKAGWLSE